MPAPAKVYILESTAASGILKVGFTTRSVRERVAELNAQTGTIGRFKVIAHFEVPMPLAEMIESRAHETLKRQGLHHSKEYFHATLDQCRAAILEAIESTGASRRPVAEVPAAALAPKHGQPPAFGKLDGVFSDRTELATAAYQAFLADTRLLRQTIVQQIQHIERLHVEAQSHRFAARLLSSAGRNADRKALDSRVELEASINAYSRRRLTFCIQSKLSGPELKALQVSLDEYDIPTSLRQCTCPALKNLLTSHSWP